MRVTVCQWPDSPQAIDEGWDGLIEHVCARHSQLVVLPEMPFSAWLPASRQFSAARWDAAVEAHRRWESRLCEAGGAAIVGSRPYTFGNERICAAFVWEADTGSRAAHANSKIRNQDGAWEEPWYTAVSPDFTPVQIGAAEVGFLFSSELQELTEAVRYGEDGVHLLITPRATTGGRQSEWLDAASAAASHAHAFGLSSNRLGDGGHLGGEGWILDPNGQILARTSESEPFVTLELDLAQARHVRRTERPELPVMSSTSAT